MVSERYSDASFCSPLHDLGSGFRVGPSPCTRWGQSADHRYRRSDVRHVRRPAVRGGGHPLRPPRHGLERHEQSSAAHTRRDMAGRGARGGRGAVDHLRSLRPAWLASPDTQREERGPRISPLSRTLPVGTRLRRLERGQLLWGVDLSSRRHRGRLLRADAARVSLVSHPGGGAARRTQHG
jgi:hypothetical protein